MKNFSKLAALSAATLLAILVMAVPSTSWAKKVKLTGSLAVLDGYGGCDLLAGSAKSAAKVGGTSSPYNQCLSDCNMDCGPDTDCKADCLKAVKKLYKKLKDDEPPPPPPRCGDGNADPGEQCGEPGLSCRAGKVCNNCKCENAPPPPPRCGDGNADPGEQCGEPGLSCPREEQRCNSRCRCYTPRKEPVCGDGTQDPGEECGEPGLSCSSEDQICRDCKCEDKPPPGPRCGDGLLNVAGETCDDGRLANNDGCDKDCHTESGWDCEGEPSVCNPKHGDGLIRGNEKCDDGNLEAGDGCDPNGQVEDGWVCEGEPSVCEKESGIPWWLWIIIVIIVIVAIIILFVKPGYGRKKIKEWLDKRKAAPKKKSPPDGGDGPSGTTPSGGGEPLPPIGGDTSAPIVPPGPVSEAGLPTPSGVPVDPAQLTELVKQPEVMSAMALALLEHSEFRDGLDSRFLTKAQFDENKTTQQSQAVMGFLGEAADATKKYAESLEEKLKGLEPDSDEAKATGLLIQVCGLFAPQLEKILENLGSGDKEFLNELKKKQEGSGQ